MNLSIKEISLSYGAVRVLHDISFKFHEAEIVAIVGPNGSGKSSFLKCFNHLVTPENGTIHLNGRDLLGLHQKEITKISVMCHSLFRILFRQRLLIRS